MSERNSRKEIEGIVVSDKMEKTIIVKIEQKKQHSKYKKTIKTSKKFVAENPGNEAKEGDFVQIMETKPLSKTKCWRLVKIIKKAVVEKGESI